MGLDEVRKLKWQAGQPKPRKIYQIPKRSAKKIAMDKLDRETIIVKSRPSKTKPTDAQVVFRKADELRRERLNIWFKQIMMKHFSSYGGNCMECSLHIPLEYARHATAHLLAKKLFHSVETHPLNYLILGAGCGCHQKTDRLDTFVQMNVWREAARRIKIMLPLLPFDELKYVSSQLYTALENID